MISINTEIDKIKKDLFVKRIQLEVSKMDSDEPRKKYLLNILSELSHKDTLFETLVASAENNACVKKWNRVPDFYKKRKIIEYMEEKYKINPKRKEIEEMLINKINKGELNTCKIVTYDTEKMKITKICISKNEIY
jgi:hypothetical protein